MQHEGQAHGIFRSTGTLKQLEKPEWLLFSSLVNTYNIIVMNIKVVFLQVN